MDVIEFYDQGEMVCLVRSSIVPHVGSMISIRMEPYVVGRVTYALDDGDEPIPFRSMRAIVNLSKIDIGKLAPRKRGE